VVPGGLYPLEGWVPSEAPTRLGDLHSGEIRHLNPFSIKSLLETARLLVLRDRTPVVVVWWTVAISLQLLLLILISTISGHPVVVDLHETSDPTEATHATAALLGKLSFRLLRRLCHFVLHSEDAAHSVLKGTTAMKKLTVIPLPLYSSYPVLERLHARALLGIQSKYLLLCFGTIRAYKGIPLAYRAFRQLPEQLRSECVLAVVGGRWRGETDRILSELAGNGARAQTIIRDRYVSDTEAGYWLSAADVLLMLYERSSQSGVARLGMSYGLDCLVSSSEEGKDIALLYEGWHVVESRDAGEISRAIVSLLRLQPRRHERPRRFEWDEVTRLYLVFLREIAMPELAGRGGGAARPK